MSGVIPHQNSLENPIMYAADKPANDANEKTPATVHSESPSKETWDEQQQDEDAISCDEDSFDEVFRSSGSGTVEEETNCPPFEPKIPVDVSLNTDATYPIHQYNSRNINIPSEDKSLLRSHTQ